MLLNLTVRTIVCSPKLYQWCKASFTNRNVIVHEDVLPGDFYFFNAKGDSRLVDTTNGLVWDGVTGRKFKSLIVKNEDIEEFTNSFFIEVEAGTQ